MRITFLLLLLLSSLLTHDTSSPPPCRPRPRPRPRPNTLTILSLPPPPSSLSLQTCILAHEPLDDRVASLNALVLVLDLPSHHDRREHANTFTIFSSCSTFPQTSRILSISDLAVPQVTTGSQAITVEISSTSSSSPPSPPPSAWHPSPSASPRHCSAPSHTSSSCPSTRQPLPPAASVKVKVPPAATVR